MALGCQQGEGVGPGDSGDQDIGLKQEGGGSERWAIAGFAGVVSPLGEAGAGAKAARQSGLRL